jgi:uncharacterized protein (DUF983 family)
MKKGSKLYSIATMTCPQCQESHMMVANPYRFSTMGEVKNKCEVCGLDFKPEPGFYYGAMYVSYGLGVAIFVTIWASCNWFFENVGVWTQISLVLIALIGLGPYLYALSKVIWANIFFSYKANATTSR